MKLNVNISRFSIVGLSIFLLGCGVGPLRPAVSQNNLPTMAWDHRPEGPKWTRATISAINNFGEALVRSDPVDIAEYCPGYQTADPTDRTAFWAGMLSVLAKHESTWHPEASGGGGRWIGLTQIAPSTAQSFGCSAMSVAALMDGAANLSCAVRIAASQVGRDNAVARINDDWRGLGRDWAPFRNAEKRADMAAFTRAQRYCRP